MGPVLVDVRVLQGEPGGTELGVLRQARPALPGRRLIGLIDPDRPPLPPAAAACLDELCANPHAARRSAPECFVQLRDDDPLSVARLLVDPAIPRLALDGRAAGAVARYWRSRATVVAPEETLWAAAAALRRAEPSSPRLAVLSPAPDLPLCRALRHLGADIFGPERLALLSPHYGQALFVLANRPEMAPLLPLLRRHGGSALLLDSCLLAAYAARAAAVLAARELGRPVPEAELRQWCDGIARPEALLLGEVASVAEALIVHSAWLADEIQRRYGRSATVVPPFPDLPRVRAEASGLQAESCVWAVEMLRAWGREVRLDLDCPSGDRPALAALAARLGVGDLIGFAPGPASLALFLAMRGQASLSASLAASAGLPCVASRGVIEAVDADARIVPDQPSPPLLAEAILAALPEAGAADAAARGVMTVLGL